MNKRSIIGGRAGSGILLEGGVSNDTKVRRRRLPGLDFNIILNLGGGRCFTPTKMPTLHRRCSVLFLDSKNRMRGYKRGRKSYSRRRLYGRGNYGYGYMRPSMSGRGSYKSMLRSAARAGARWLKPRTAGYASKIGGALGGLAGGAAGTYLAPGIGSAAGAAGGAKAGQWVGQQIAKATGWGDYNLDTLNRLLPDRVVPMFGDDCIRVRHRECINPTLNATTDFLNQVYPLNPGLDGSFPWLSQIARNFEQYRFNGLIFQFISTTSDAIASSVNLGFGQVIMATDYNAADAPYQNEVQMLGSTFANSEKPSRDCLHAVECAAPDQAQKLYYIRSGAVPSGQDPRLYDLGLFQFATSRMQADYPGMGQLWVSYDVTFVKKVMNSQLGLDLNTDTYNLYPPGFTDAVPLQGFLPSSRSNIGTYITNGVASSTLHFPDYIQSGIYYAVVKWRGLIPDTLDVPTTTLNACTPSNLTMGFEVNSGVNTTDLAVTGFFRITGPGATITFANDGVLPKDPQPLGSYVFVTQVNAEVMQSTFA